MFSASIAMCYMGQVNSMLSASVVAVFMTNYRKFRSYPTHSLSIAFTKVLLPPLSEFGSFLSVRWPAWKLSLRMTMPTHARWVGKVQRRARGQSDSSSALGGWIFQEFRAVADSFLVIPSSTLASPLLAPAMLFKRPFCCHGCCSLERKSCPDWHRLFRADQR